MRALKTKEVSAIAKIALRNKESLCVLRPAGETLVLETLFYPDEIRAQEDVPSPDVLVSQQELAMAHGLIDLLQEPFDPSKYHDEYRSALLEVIEAKRNGAAVVAAPEAPAMRTVDLMAALKASLEAAKKAKQPLQAAANGSSEANGVTTTTPEASEEIAVA
jgi:DNA end-binding protein Ku